MTNVQVFQTLVSLAKNRKKISYQVLSDQCGLGLDMRFEHHRDQIGKLLGAISTQEHEQHRPLISVLVFRDDKNIPGKGFFKLANRLGKFAGSRNYNAKHHFFVNELQATYRFWGDQP